MPSTLSSIGNVHSVRARLALLAVWVGFGAVMVRWWEIGSHLTGLLLWTTLSGLLYLVTIFVVGPPHPTVAARLSGLGRPAIALIGMVIVVFAAHTLWPHARIGALRVATGMLVGFIDAVLALWLLVKTLLAIWPGPVRWVVLVAAVPFALVTTWVVSIRMPGSSHRDPLPPISAEQQALAGALARHVRTLAGEIGPRNDDYYEGMEAAAAYIERELAASGSVVEVVQFAVAGRTYRNLQVTIPGASSREIVVVGAHYDSAGDALGADDNASGVAALIELVRRLRTASPTRTIRAVFFANEEPPFFDTQDMGSRVAAAAAAERREPIIAMLSLETIGYYATGAGSQRYPFPFSLFYPDRADFIGFVGNLASGRLVRRAVEVFRRSTPFPSEGSAAYAFIPGISWSDHSSYWRHGYPAIMVTDTAPFRNPNYHLTTDAPETLDYDRMARVVEGLEAVVRDLAGVGSPAT